MGLSNSSWGKKTGIVHSKNSLFICFSWIKLWNEAIVQDNWSPEKSNISHGCCIWHGVFTWEEYCPFRPEVWESTSEHEGSTASHMQGLVPNLFPWFLVFLGELLLPWRILSPDFSPTQYFLIRLVISDYQRLNSIHWYPVVSEEPYPGWHQSFWVGKVIWCQRR